MKMNTQRYWTAVMALLILVVAVLACSSGDEVKEANKLVDEGNSAVKEAKKYVADAEEKKQKMLKTPVAELEDARATAKEAIAAYDKAKEQCKEASKKYEEASKLKVKEKFKEYLTLKMKEWDKRAEVVETAKGTPQALIDSESRSSFISMANANNERVDRLNKEADDLAAQADKVQKDNPDIFKP
jgi:predicted ribosome quality control (RQC) complex YloA/Tae2 family protein